MPSNHKLCEITYVKENGFCENQVGGRNKICVYVFLQFPKSLGFFCKGLTTCVMTNGNAVNNVHLLRHVQTERSQRQKRTKDSRIK